MPNPFENGLFVLTAIYPSCVYTPYNNPMQLLGVRVNLSSALLAWLSSTKSCLNAKMVDTTSLFNIFPLISHNSALL